MANGNRPEQNARRVKHRAYWQQDWMTKVLSNGYCSFAKLLFMRIASFGEKGCWMNNETLSEELNRSERTIRRAVSSLWSSGDLIVVGWNGHGRRMYAAKAPGVVEAIELDYGRLRSKGKVKDVQEYRSKVRMRLRAETPQK